MEIERKRKNNPVMDIAPLVDVVFLLLLFFLMTSRIVSEPVIRVRLPESKTSEVEGRREIVISVTGDGFIYLDGTPMVIGDITAALRAKLAATGTDMPVRVRADRESTLGLIVQVIDEVKMSGAATFSIVTEKPIQ